MSGTQNLTHENFLPQNFPDENSPEEKIPGELVFFSKDELSHFLDEVQKQFSENGAVDFGKATRNARYLARLDRAFKNVEEGRWTEHELIEVVDDE